jgi:hypothetical protein
MLRAGVKLEELKNRFGFNLLATDFFFQILAHLYLKCE